MSKWVKEAWHLSFQSSAIFHILSTTSSSFLLNCLAPALPLIFPAFLCVANLSEFSSCYLLFYWFLLPNILITINIRLQLTYNVPHIAVNNVRRLLSTLLVIFLVCYTNMPALKISICIMKDTHWVPRSSGNTVVLFDQITPFYLFHYHRDSRVSSSLFLSPSV